MVFHVSIYELEEDVWSIGSQVRSFPERGYGPIHFTSAFGLDTSLHELLDIRRRGLLLYLRWKD
jgi:hypothetical protein